MIDAQYITNLQKEKTVLWHEVDPAVSQDASFSRLIQSNHLQNFLLWHKEDEARRDDCGADYVCQAKRAIDGFNQQRNNFMEKIDQHLLDELGPLNVSAPRHTETPGMIIDRLSILALKEFHMHEETVRPEASSEHVEKCAFKLSVIQKQLSDLAAGLQAFLGDIESGARSFNVYYQFKMYNDPSLNPQLYKQSSNA